MAMVSLRPRLACRAWRVLLALLLAAGTSSILLLPERSAAQDDVQVTEARIKAVFLFKFAGYVEWPEHAFADPQTPFVIGVLHADGLAAELAQIVAGRAVQGRPVEVRRLRAGDALDGLHVLFVGRAGRSALRDTLARLSGQPTLRVTESDGALSAGSMINFVLVEGKVRFDIVPPTDAGGLRISSRLLAVARDVREGT